MLVKPVIRKDLAWSYEKEWRIIDISNYFENSSDYCCLPFVKPKALHLGYNISESDEDKLCSICRSKGIDICKMRIGGSDGTNTITSEPLT
jgi:hypothetical protein